MRIIDQLMEKILDASRAIAEPVLSQPIQWMWLTGLIPVMFWLVGRKLSLIVKPERPYLSPILRFFGLTTKWLGLIAIAIELFGFVVLLALLFIHQLLSGSNIVDAIKEAWMFIYQLGGDHILQWLYGCMAGVTIALPVLLYYLPRWERGSGLTNVDELIRRYRKYNNYDPRRYIKIERGCFIGLDTKREPIYIPWTKLRQTHMQSLGETGCGKGVAMTLIAYQCILAGECVIWFDPKFDRFSPRALQLAAEMAGVKFNMININHNGNSRINPLIGAEHFQIVELFQSAFDLIGKGTDGDFHRGRDLDAAEEAASVSIKSVSLSIPELYKQCSSIKSITSQENFWRKFRKLATLPAINTDAGFNLPAAIENREVIYFVGSSDNEQILMLQKMLLVRIMQILKSRKRLKKHAPTCIVMDEFTYMLSPAALTGLRVVRDFNVHITLGHQAISDLESCPGIEPAVAKGAVEGNTGLKIIYKIGDAEYSEKLAKISGKHLTHVEISSKQPDETGAATGSWREDEIDNIDKYLLPLLPMPSDRDKQASVGVLFGLGKAQVFYVGPIPIPEAMPMPESDSVSEYCDTSTNDTVTEFI